MHEREQELRNMLTEFGFADKNLAAARNKISSALKMVSDPNTHNDSGMSADGEMDFYITIAGIEYSVFVLPPRKKS